MADRSKLRELSPGDVAFLHLVNLATLALIASYPLLQTWHEANRISSLVLLTMPSAFAAIMRQNTQFARLYGIAFYSLSAALLIWSIRKDGARDVMIVVAILVPMILLGKFLDHRYSDKLVSRLKDRDAEE